MTQTKQRTLILNTLTAHANHPTAEQLFQCVRAELPSISLGTVYRNLNNMADAGMIRRLTVPNAPDRYDACTHVHDHMVCTCCGRLTDFTLPQPLMPQLEGTLGVQISGYQLVVSGVCADCAGKLNVAN